MDLLVDIKKHYFLYQELLFLLIIDLYAFVFLFVVIVIEYVKYQVFMRLLALYLDQYIVTEH